MNIRDGLVATITLAVSTLAMAGVVGSGAYAQAAGAEARGVHALSSAMAHTLCDGSGTTLAVAVTTAAPEVTQ